MLNDLACDEITHSVVDMSWSGAETLGGFFQFERYDRKFSDTELLQDCHIYQLHPVKRVSSWPEQPGPPDPEVFRELFPDLVHALLKSDLSLYLYIKAVDREFFDEASVLARTIKPISGQYMILSPIATKSAPGDIGNLIFECAESVIPDVPGHWFHSPTIDMEGYVMNKREFSLLADCYFRPDSVETVRRALSIMRLGFRLWPDFNGLDLFSERMDSKSLHALLCPARR